MISELADILYTIAPGIGAIFGLIFVLHKSPIGKYVLMLLGLYFLIELTALIWYELKLGKEYHNVFLNSISDLTSLSIISAMVYEITKKSKLSLGIGLFALIVVAVFIFLIEGFNSYAPIAYSLQELGIILLCLNYFYYIFNNETDLFIQENTEFITICVLLVLHSGSLFTSIMILQITENNTTYALYDLQLLLDSIGNFALIFVLWRIYKQKRKLEASIF